MASTEERFTPRTDLITFEVLRHRLWQINDEQGRSIINVSGSPVASEVNDFNVGLADAGANLICLGPYNLLHVSNTGLMMKNAWKTLGESQIGEDDIYICNDPWMGAVHHSDVCFISPVFFQRKLVAWAASTIHQVDIGGVAPGSWNPLARDTFQEAPRYRFLKVVRGGKVQTEVVETYLTNSRTPHLLELDLRAQIAAANVARERLTLLFAKYGVEVVQGVMADMLDYTEYLMRRRLREIPDGEWYAEDYLDHNGHEEKIHTLRLHLKKEDTSLTFDFTGTDPQAEGPINSTFGGLLGGLFAGTATFICNDIPWNDGILRTIKIISEEGTVNNCAFPAPCGMGTISGCVHTRNVCSSAIAKMLSCSETWRRNLMGVWGGSAFVFNVFGKNQYGDRFGTMMVNSHMGGAGARYFKDGHDNSGGLSVPRASVTNVESAEAIYPVLYLFRRRAVDSGGAGLFRGGVSGENAITPYGTESLNFVVSTLGCNHSSSISVGGGYPGGGAQPLLKRGTDIIGRMAKGLVPSRWEEIPGDEIVLPAKVAFELHRGDVFNGVPHGGGGFGDPIERDPLLVQEDVRQGFVSSDFALRVYGVAIDPVTCAMRVEATNTRRLEIRKGRLAGTSKELSLRQVRPNWRELVEDGIRLGETFRVKDGWVICARCEEKIAHWGSNPKKGLIEVRRALGETSPWIARRWRGMSPDFVFIEYVCPGCGYLIDAAQRRVGEVEPWDDYRLASDRRAGTFEASRERKEV